MRSDSGHFDEEGTQDEIPKILSTRVLSLLFDLSFSSSIRDNKKYMESLALAEERADAVKAVIGNVMAQSDFLLSETSNGVIDRVCQDAYEIYVDVYAPLSKLLSFFNDIGICNGMDYIICTRVGESLFICRCQCPAMNCIVGDCFVSLQMSMESLVQRVISKAIELKIPKRARSEDVFATVLCKKTVPSSQSRPKQRLLNLLQKCGLQESLGEILKTEFDSCDSGSHARFISVFLPPKSLAHNPQVQKFPGSIIGERCSSKKLAEDSVCELVLNLMLQ